MKYAQNPQEYILQRSIPEPMSGCWLWINSISSNGYGHAVFRKKYYSSHRLSYIAFNGEFNRQLIVCHKCDNKLCVNPLHLFIGSQKDNIKDMIRKNRKHPIETNKAYKFTWEIIRKMRKEYESGLFSQGDILRKYGSCRSNICFIINKKTWIE